MSKVPLPFSELSTAEWIKQLQQATTPESRLRALQAVGYLSNADDAAHTSAQVLQDSDPTVRALAAKLTGGSKAAVATETESQLVSLLSDEDPDVRYESAKSLIRLKSPQASKAVDGLFAFLDEPETHPLMQAAVINALVQADLNAEQANQQVGPRLEKLIEQERAELREAVADAFAKWPTMGTACWERLLPLLDDAEPVVREKMALMFGQLGIDRPEIRSALETAAQDEDSEVARVAQESLARL